MSSSGVSQQFVFEARARDRQVAVDREWARLYWAFWLSFLLLLPAMAMVGVVSICSYRPDPRTEAYELLKLVEVYRLKEGRYPISFAEMSEGRYLTRPPLDRFGHGYVLGFRTMERGEVPMVRGCGEDGVLFSADDVVVW